MRNLRRAATAVVALSLVAAACGSDDDGGTTEGSEPEATTGETTRLEFRHVPEAVRLVRPVAP